MGKSDIFGVVGAIGVPTLIFAVLIVSMLNCANAWR